MIKIFGPSYRYQGEILTEPEIIYLDDHHYDETNRCFHLELLLKNSACDPQKHLIVFEGFGHDDILAKYNHICIPGFTARTSREFANEGIQPIWTQKTKCFNFMINKPRLHRNFLLMLIEHFKLSNYSYSLPWRNNQLSCAELLGLTNNKEYCQIINNNLTVDIPVTDYRFGSEVVLDQGVQNGSYRNPLIYDKLLRTTVFEPSCISLITDPIFFERETKISEKTVMAIYGGTIPIWVGGWRAADRLRNLGFDVFDDLVDHSYQDLADPLDRVYYAVERNLDLLSDFDRAHQFVVDNTARLQHNLTLCQSNIFYDLAEQKIAQFDSATQEEIRKLIYEPHRQSNFSKTLGENINANSPAIVPVDKS